MVAPGAKEHLDFGVSRAGKGQMSNESAKASGRIAINTRLIGVTFASFFLTLNFRGELLQHTMVLLQLVVAIPVLFTSTLAYSKVSYRSDVVRWNRLGWVTFAVGYSFLINVVGIIIGLTAGKALSATFFAACWLLALIYSAVDISETRSALVERIAKDAVFIVLQLFLGLLVALQVY